MNLKLSLNYFCVVLKQEHKCLVQERVAILKSNMRQLTYATHKLYLKKYYGLYNGECRSNGCYI